MFFAKIPRHASQNAITEGDFKCILARNCEGTEQLRFFVNICELLQKNFLIMTMNRRILHGNYWKH